jgi:LacI family transcriptional regulator, repressor for deo operon, udp, cdd, tsx, nupC, and nupG
MDTAKTTATDATAGRHQPTIYDVARACGVAPSTVSRAFSRPGRVNPRTAERIFAAAERIGYRTNPLARALPTGKTALIALVVSDVTNPVYFPIIRGTEGAVAKAGYTLVLADAQESGVTEREAVERVLPFVEGVVLAGSRVSDSAVRKHAQQVPLVVANRAVRGVPSVITDNPRGVRQAVEHLNELGHRAITYVAGPEASWADGVRWQAVREVCSELRLHCRRVGPYAPTLSGGMRATTDVNAHRTTAVITYNDLLAFGLIRGLTRAGVRVPTDVSVVGFDNIFASDYCTPALTTVAAPLRALGSAAVEQLVAQIGGARAHTENVGVLPAKLVIRESTARPAT